MESGGNPPNPGQQSPAEPGPQAPAGPQSPAQPYGGQMPPGGWSQPIPAGAVKFASWWARVGATIVDGLVIFVPAFVIAAILGVGAVASDNDGAFAFVGGIILTFLIAAIVGIFYAPVLMARAGEHNGQTWGKQITSCKVIRANGQPFDFGSAAVREIAVKWLLFGVVGGFFASIPTLVNWLWPLWDDQNRALHDMIVDTRVVEA